MAGTNRAVPEFKSRPEIMDLPTLKHYFPKLDAPVKAAVLQMASGQTDGASLTHQAIAAAVIISVSLKEYESGQALTASFTYSDKVFTDICTLPQEEQRFVNPIDYCLSKPAVDRIISRDASKTAKGSTLPSALKDRFQTLLLMLAKSGQTRVFSNTLFLKTFCSFAEHYSAAAASGSDSRLIENLRSGGTAELEKYFRYSRLYPVLPSYFTKKEFYRAERCSDRTLLPDTDGSPVPDLIPLHWPASDKGLYLYCSIRMLPRQESSQAEEPLMALLARPLILHSSSVTAADSFFFTVFRGSADPVNNSFLRDGLLPMLSYRFNENTGAADNGAGAESSTNSDIILLFDRDELIKLSGLAGIPGMTGSILQSIKPYSAMIGSLRSGSHFLEGNPDRRGQKNILLSASENDLLTAYSGILGCNKNELALCMLESSLDRHSSQDSDFIRDLITSASARAKDPSQSLTVTATTVAAGNTVIKRVNELVYSVKDAYDSFLPGSSGSITFKSVCHSLVKEELDKISESGFNVFYSSLSGYVHSADEAAAKAGTGRLHDDIPDDARPAAFWEDIFRKQKNLSWQTYLRHSGEIDYGKLAKIII